MTNYHIGDFLIQIKNAAMGKNHEVALVATRQEKAVAETLKKAGYLQDFSEKDGVLAVRLAYRDKEPVLSGLKLVSKPGKRVYMKVGEIGKKKGPSTLLISTAKGIMTSKEAIKLGVGGEVIAEII